MDSCLRRNDKKPDPVPELVSGYGNAQMLQLKFGVFYGEIPAVIYLKWSRKTGIG
ncbi:hypothetical protein ACGK9U_11595 [Mariniflexile sp. HNIBRBA6329]|uniref:hypothetical protein n=1 Tax=Mariniflexile sp. HNIBRBA6329 TaxID=3373088 RepID=UPI003744E79A